MLIQEIEQNKENATSGGQDQLQKPHPVPSVYISLGS